MTDPNQTRDPAAALQAAKRLAAKQAAARQADSSSTTVDASTSNPASIDTGLANTGTTNPATSNTASANPVSANTASADERPARPASAGRKKPTSAAKASRWVAAGGAVGASLAMIGVMSAAASQGESAPAEATPTVRRVVVPRQTATVEPIVIVLPDANGAVVAAQPAQVTAAGAPRRPAAPAPAPATAPAPVTESSGS